MGFRAGDRESGFAARKEDAEAVLSSGCRWGLGGAGRGEGREDQESESEGLKQGRMTQRLRRLQVRGEWVWRGAQGQGSVQVVRLI